MTPTPICIELSPIEKRIDVLLQKSGYFLQTHRSIEALSALSEALEITESNDIQWQVRASVYGSVGEAHIQMGHFDEGIASFIKSFDVIEDNNRKAATASHIADYYLRKGEKQLALEYAEKALEIATAQELKAVPYQIHGGVAILNGDYPEAIQWMNKAAECAEQSHCLTDLAMIIMDISAIFMKMGKPETALSEIYRAERYVKECRSLDLYRRCAIRRAKILFMMGKDEDAKKLIMALDDQHN